MKAETNKTVGSRESTAPPTPNGASTPEESEGQESPNGEDLRSSPSVASIASISSKKGKKKATETKSGEGTTQDGKESTGASNLVGKINNLVTNDLTNLTNARDFLFIRLLHLFFSRSTRLTDITTQVVYIPLQISLCVWFLYAILGWRYAHESSCFMFSPLTCASSSFVGLAVMILLFPIPGYIAKLIQNVQVQAMKKVTRLLQHEYP